MTRAGSSPQQWPPVLGGGEAFAVLSNWVSQQTVVIFSKHFLKIRTNSRKWRITQPLIIQLMTLSLKGWSQQCQWRPLVGLHLEIETSGLSTHMCVQYLQIRLQGQDLRGENNRQSGNCMSRVSCTWPLSTWGPAPMHVSGRQHLKGVSDPRETTHCPRSRRRRTDSQLRDKQQSKATQSA